MPGMSKLLKTDMEEHLMKHVGSIYAHEKTGKNK